MMLFAAVSLLFITSCKKEVEGPQGPKGDTGNANVMAFNYSSRTFTGSTNYTIPNISQEVMDKSVVLAYYNPANETPTAWYPVPGLGSGSNYDTRFIVYKEEASSPDYIFALRLVNPSTNAAYASEVTFTKFKILIIPASSSTNVLMPLEHQPDYNDYHAVRAFYGLED